MSKIGATSVDIGIGIGIEWVAGQITTPMVKTMVHENSNMKLSPSTFYHKK